MSRYVRSRYNVNKSVNFRSLSDDEREQIFYAALEVLERTGVKIFDDESRKYLEEAGCWIEDKVVKIPISLSEWAVDSAPSKILLYDRDGNRKLNINTNNTYYGPGPTNTYHKDPDTGERRRPILEDTERVAKVVDYLPNIDFAMDLGTPTGVTDNIADVYAFKTMVENTTKPVVHWGFDIEQYQDIIDIAAAVRGSLEELQKKPFMFLYSEPTSPLLHSREAIAKVVFAAKNKIPIVYTPCVMSGATTPATMAGTIVQGISESIAGIVVSQLVRKGTPIIMGGVYGIMDMKTTIFSYGSPEFHLLQAGVAEVAHYMGVPIFGTGGCTDSHTMDGQAAAESAMSILTAALAGANMVHDVGYTASGQVGSLDQLVMGDEIIGMVRRIMRGIEVNDEHLAVDVIDNVGPGGHFLGEEHTLKHFKEETWFPDLINRMRYDGWKTKAGGTSMGERIKEKVHKIVDTHEVKHLPDDVKAKIEEIIEKAEKREANKDKSKKNK
ncbi:MAG: trimethylamine methyltransferase family protein [Halanaerobiales bacterium]|nr:trimethylamine methyltransferase family protein [Halanaerobiales bacterium]